MTKITFLLRKLFNMERHSKTENCTNQLALYLQTCKKFLLHIVFDIFFQLTVIFLLKLLNLTKKVQFQININEVKGYNANFKTAIMTFCHIHTASLHLMATI